MLKVQHHFFCIDLVSHLEQEYQIFHMLSLQIIFQKSQYRNYDFMKAFLKLILKPLKSQVQFRLLTIKQSYIFSFKFLFNRTINYSLSNCLSFFANSGNFLKILELLSHDLFSIAGKPLITFPSSMSQ